MKIVQHSALCDQGQGHVTYCRVVSCRLRVNWPLHVSQHDHATSY